MVKDYWSVSKSEGSDAVHESGEHQDMGVVDVSETAEKMDTAQIIKPDDMPDESDMSAVKIGKVVPYDSVKVDFKDMPPIEISDGCSNEPDMIQKPPHHNKFTFQPIDIIAEVTNYYEGSTAFHIGTALKYLCRAPFKGKLIEDLKKANYYLTRAIDEMEE